MKFMKLLILMMLIASCSTTQEQTYPKFSFTYDRAVMYHSESDSSIFYTSEVGLYYDKPARKYLTTDTLEQLFIILGYTPDSNIYVEKVLYTPAVGEELNFNKENVISNKRP